jgi:hypothetical protein
MAYLREYGRKQLLSSQIVIPEGWVNLTYSWHAIQMARTRMKGMLLVLPEYVHVSSINISRGYSADGVRLEKVIIRQEFTPAEWVFMVIILETGFVKSIWFEEKASKMKPETEEQWKFFQEIWKTLPPEKRCQSCDKRIYGPPKPLYFDHLLEKSKHPELRLEKDNIFICCGDCHAKKNMGFPTSVHAQAVEKAKELFLNNQNQEE